MLALPTTTFWPSERRCRGNTGTVSPADTLIGHEGQLQLLSEQAVLASAVIRAELM